MITTQPQRKKLIEVALPLEAINQASARENYIYKGNPSAVHKWWAQRPLAAARAVLFAQLVDDPSNFTEKFPTEKEQDLERQRLFSLIEELVKWENMNNEELLKEAYAEILKSNSKNEAPSVLDPFAGGGTIPLEAQRLGLSAYASDLNPVAVLTNKGLIEIPPRFIDQPPVHPDRGSLLPGRVWKGSTGLAEDIRYYGRWMRDEAERKIGHLYPSVTLPSMQGGGRAVVIAWLWARTIKCPNPACSGKMPLVRSFWLSTRKGKKVWVKPEVDSGSAQPTMRFTVRTDQGQPPEGTVTRRGATCLICGTPVPLAHIRSEGQANRIGSQLLAIVADGPNGRTYLSPTSDHESIAANAQPEYVPNTNLPEQALGFRVQLYGMRRHRDLFTARQLVTLTTFSDLVEEVRNIVIKDALAVGLTSDGVSLNEGGRGARAYADAIATYLAFACDKMAMYGCALVPWYAKEDRPSMLFGRQAISMVWDFTEVNPFTDIGGSAIKSIAIVADSIEPLANKIPGIVSQLDAASHLARKGVVISTDPPYYDNVPYADLSDFFYVWLRRSLGKVYPEIFSTLLVPKNQELVADPYRYGSRDKAEEHFVKGMLQAFSLMRQNAHPEYPITVYYAFKQSETEQEGDEGNDDSYVASTGWETMLEGLIKAGFMITGTWPMRTERTGRLRDAGSNALASSIVLVCRQRPDVAPLATRREFLNALKRELPDALKKLQHGNIAPVDLAQASIGPGMAVFSRYSKVVESEGSPMRVRTALQLINQALDEVLAEQESEYDAETRWAVAWFDQFGTNEGAYGTAETLSKAKNTSVSGMDEAGVTTSRAGKVRLLRRDEMPKDWSPTDDSRITVWEVTQHLIRALDEGGEQAAATLLGQVGGLGDVARDLAYRLYTTSERKGWTQEALAYNSLVVAWPEISRLATAQPAQPSGTLF